MAPMDLLLIGVVYLGLAAAVALFAEWRGRKPLAWFGISLLFTPLLAFVAAVLVGKR